MPLSLRQILAATSLCVFGGVVFAQERIVVGIKQVPPFAMKDAQGRWSGVTVDLWRIIAERRQIAYEFREVGLEAAIDQTAAGRIDLVVGALTVTASREKKLDFSHPFYSAGLGIAVNSEERAGAVALLEGLFSPAFVRAVWGLITVLLMIGTLIWLVERRNNAVQFGGPWWRGIGAGWWWSAVTMTTVGYGDKVPVSPVGRLLAVVWMFASLILISGFTAAIAASLTAGQIRSRVQGLEDLPKVRVGTVVNSASAEYLAARRWRFRGFDSVKSGLQALAAGRIQAFVYDEPVLRYYVHQMPDAPVTTLNQIFLRQDYAFALPSGSALREPLNQELLDILAGESWQHILFRYLGK